MTEPRLTVKRSTINHLQDPIVKAVAQIKIAKGEYTVIEDEQPCAR